MSLLVFTRNSAETLPRLLETTGWAAERVVVDMRNYPPLRQAAF
jgi:hypothetical protein